VVVVNDPVKDPDMVPAPAEIGVVKELQRAEDVAAAAVAFPELRLTPQEPFWAVA
jgi:hypothetical protein